MFKRFRVVVLIALFPAAPFVIAFLSYSGTNEQVFAAFIASLVYMFFGVVTAGPFITRLVYNAIREQTGLEGGERPLIILNLWLPVLVMNLILLLLDFMSWIVDGTDPFRAKRFLEKITGLTWREIDSADLRGEVD